MRLVWALLFLVCSISVYARPVYEFSDDGVYFRVHNPDKRAYYCIIELGSGASYEKIVYPGQYTRWYSMRNGYSVDCST